MGSDQGQRTRDSLLWTPEGATTPVGSLSPQDSKGHDKAGEVATVQSLKPGAVFPTIATHRRAALYDYKDAA